MTLSRRIKEVRATTGLNKSQFGKLAGVSHAAVGQWENDETKSIKFSILMKIQKDTGFSAAWIDSGRGPKKVNQTTDTNRTESLRDVENSDSIKAKLELLSIDTKIELSKMTIEQMQRRLSKLQPAQLEIIQSMLESWQPDQPD